MPPRTQGASLCIIVASAGLGIFLIACPGKAIHIQKKFYEKINWRMEPISMPREVRNTAYMGWFLLFLSGVFFIYTIIKIIKF